MTTTLAPIDVVETERTEDPEQAAHIVFVPPHLRGEMSPQQYVTKAIFEGTEVEALCGHRWIPSRNPRELPLCQRCLEVYQQPGDHRDSRDELPDA